MLRTKTDNNNLIFICKNFGAVNIQIRKGKQANDYFCARS